MAWYRCTLDPCWMRCGIPHRVPGSGSRIWCACRHFHVLEHRFRCTSDGLTIAIEYTCTPRWYSIAYPCVYWIVFRRNGNENRNRETENICFLSNIQPNRVVRDFSPFVSGPPTDTVQHASGSGQCHRHLHCQGSQDCKSKEVRDRASTTASKASYTACTALPCPLVAVFFFHRRGRESR